MCPLGPFIDLAMEHVLFHNTSLQDVLCDSLVL